MTTYNVRTIDTTNYTEEKLNKLLESLPPINNIQTSGRFLFVKTQSMLTDKGAWDKYFKQSTKRLEHDLQNTLSSATD